MLITQTLEELVLCDPEVVSGAPVLRGTRVPIKNLFDYLKGGSNLDEFFEDFPSVRREQAEAILELTKQMLISRVGGR